MLSLYENRFMKIEEPIFTSWWCPFKFGHYCVEKATETDIKNHLLRCEYRQEGKTCRKCGSNWIVNESCIACDFF